MEVVRGPTETVRVDSAADLLELAAAEGWPDETEVRFVTAAVTVGEVRAKLGTAAVTVRGNVLGGEEGA